MTWYQINKVTYNICCRLTGHHLPEFTLGAISSGCKRCGGKSAAVKKGDLSGNMLSSSNIGLELPRDIEPCVNWKTAPKGRRRAVRRARTSVSGESNRQKAATTNSNGSENASDEEFKEADQVLASESEKVCL
jgi:hypothetical protein